MLNELALSVNCNIVSVSQRQAEKIVGSAKELRDKCAKGQIRCYIIKCAKASDRPKYNLWDCIKCSDITRKNKALKMYNNKKSEP